MTELFRPTSFRLLRLRLRDLGPLRNTTDLSLTDAAGRPVNVYLVMGPNGAGKTTVLEAIYCAMHLLDAREHNFYGMEALEQSGAGVQLDALVTLDDGDRSQVFVLSIVAGESGLLANWSTEELERVGATRQLKLFYSRRSALSVVSRNSSSDPEAVGFAEAILEHGKADPTALFDQFDGFPTVLYFPSDRGIRRPPDGGRSASRPPDFGYRASHRFDLDGNSWESSLDNLFVWFAWLGDGREEACRELVNTLVFKGTKRLGSVHRPSMSVPVEVDGASHRLDQLSSGERQLLQFVVRVASHTTGSTIVLLDEAEQHLHLVLRRRLMNIIKQWAKDYESMTFLVTSHQTDLMRILAPKLAEEGLVKGGCLVKPRFKLTHE